MSGQKMDSSVDKKNEKFRKECRMPFKKTTTNLLYIWNIALSFFNILFGISIFHGFVFCDSDRINFIKRL